MSLTVTLAQLLNGLQLGMLLFLLSAGLTLVFGIMNFVNLTHGSIYMFGAYFGATAYNLSGSFSLAILAAVVGTTLLGALLERIALSTLYARDHLDQVLCTFGLMLVANEAVRFVWGPSGLYISAPHFLSGAVTIGDWSYPVYRAAIIVVGAVVASGLYVVIQHTRIGMLIRAGAANATMVDALGVNIGRLNLAIFAIGAGLAGLAGVMAAPLLSVQPGMGDHVLILTFVVIVTGGIGSIRGALYGALIVGVVDTMGRAFLPLIFREFIDRSFAQSAGPAIASMLIYILMAGVLAVRPQGLFPVKVRRR